MKQWWFTLKCNIFVEILALLAVKITSNKCVGDWILKTLLKQESLQLYLLLSKNSKPNSWKTVFLDVPIIAPVIAIAAMGSTFWWKKTLYA